MPFSNKTGDMDGSDFSFVCMVNNIVDIVKIVSIECLTLGEVLFDIQYTVWAIKHPLNEMYIVIFMI